MNGMFRRTSLERGVRGGHAVGCECRRSDSGTAGGVQSKRDSGTDPTAGARAMHIATLRGTAAALFRAKT